MRFSGHETFALRIAWLPKAVESIEAGEDPLTRPDQGIVSLGLGKNMVSALRFWVEAFNIATFADKKWQLSEFGRVVFSQKGGLDPYLEDPLTSWLLHWQISTHRENPLYAWDSIINRWNEPSFSVSQMMDFFRKGIRDLERAYSDVTLRQHLDVFIHTYCLRGNEEESLDSPLAELGLLRTYGEREGHTGRGELICRIDGLPKPSISSELFRFALEQWWQLSWPEEETLPVREITSSPNSPGRVFRLPESDVVDRLTDLARKSPESFEFVESLNQRQIRRNPSKYSETENLSDIYRARTPQYA
jgi:hypothetical protein